MHLYRVQCEVFGVTDGSTCVRATLDITFAAGCGGFEMILGTDTFEQTQALMCCDGDDCNEDMTINDVDDDCDENEDFAQFNKDLFGCLIGSEGASFTCPDSDLALNCDNLKDYLMWEKGCACTAANNLYDISSGDLKTYLEERVQSFLDGIGGISGDNVNDWNDYLQCEFEWSCNIQTGDVTISEPTSAPTPMDMMPPTVDMSAVAPLQLIFSVMFSVIFVVLY